MVFTYILALIVRTILYIHYFIAWRIFRRWPSGGDTVGDIRMDIGNVCWFMDDHFYGGNRRFIMRHPEFVHFWMAHDKMDGLNINWAFAPELICLKYAQKHIERAVVNLEKLKPSNEEDRWGDNFPSLGIICLVNSHLKNGSWHIDQFFKERFDEHHDSETVAKLKDLNNQVKETIKDIDKYVMQPVIYNDIDSPEYFGTPRWNDTRWLYMEKDKIEQKSKCIQTMLDAISKMTKPIIVNPLFT